ncbi:Pseudouridine synthase [hydrothermal vent metagenome]|uniref:Pseudouridine synthase n=1 Tax=hydrothermal vent metagenome TaxID=652676 RepID=A0A3B0WZ54_9ZZZZ
MSRADFVSVDTSANDNTVFEKHIPVEREGETLIDCMDNNTEISRQQLKRLLHNGGVWLETTHRNGTQSIERTRRAKKTLKQSDTVHVYYNAKIQSEPPAAAELVADEGGYSIWNKPSGMYSQGSKWGDHCTLYRWAEKKLQPQRPAFIVHRLDRAANGLIILAHKKSVAAMFSAMFENHRIDKKYKAVVEGVVSDISLPHRIKNRLDNKNAVSEIISVKTNTEKNISEVEMVIETGRKHQIRRHLSEMGYPIVGDRLYGAKSIEMDLQLSSVSLGFVCPVTSVQKKYQLITDKPH